MLPLIKDYVGRNVILVCSKYFRFRAVKPLESNLPLHHFLTTHAQSVKALVCSGWKPLSAETLRCLPSLELVVTTSTGFDHIDLEECRRRGIRIANAGDVYSADTADFCVGLLLALLRRVSAADFFVRQGLWSHDCIWDYPLGSRLGGKQVGLVGLGRIGSQIAKRLEAFGCRISYTARKEKPPVSFPYYSNVCDLASNSDILIVCCALNDETHHIINREVLLALGKNGVIVNVGRGALVHEKELVQCLVQGEIAGAGLDVFENEPNVPKELFELENVVLTPHEAVHTLESYSAIHDHVLENLDAFFSGKPLHSEISF